MFRRSACKVCRRKPLAALVTEQQYVARHIGRQSRQEKQTTASDLPLWSKHCARAYSNKNSSASTTTSGGNKLATLMLLRHGQSTYNAIPTFTGWCDAPLTDRGIAQAKASGKLLKERGYECFDVAFTSNLQRARHTCELVLKELQPKPQEPRQDSSDGNVAPTEYTSIIQSAWELNERHYGSLQGQRKDSLELLERYGPNQLKSWRREFYSTPPPMDESHPHYLPPPAPLTESLADCQERVLRYWYESITPTLSPGATVLLVAHSNTLRALVAHLDNVPIEGIPNIHIPNSVPCVYTLDEKLQTLPSPPPGDMTTPASTSTNAAYETATDGQGAATRSGAQWLFSAENSERLHNKIGTTNAFGRSIFDAWDVNGDGRLSRDELGKGLRELFGSENPTIAAIAGKAWEEMLKDKFHDDHRKRLDDDNHPVLSDSDEYGDDSVTFSLEEFQSYVLKGCRKHNLPFWMEGANDTPVS